MSITMWIFVLLLIVFVILVIIQLSKSGVEGETGRGTERRGFWASRREPEEQGQLVQLRGREFRCPKCGAIVDPIDARCPNCGAEFEIGKYACPECGAPVTLSDIYCPHCGALLLAEPYVCPRCLRIVPPESRKCPWCGVEYWSPIRLDDKTFKMREKKLLYLQKQPRLESVQESEKYRGRT